MWKQNKWKVKKKEWFLSFLSVGFTSLICLKSGRNIRLLFLANEKKNWSIFCWIFLIYFLSISSVNNMNIIYYGCYKQEMWSSKCLWESCFRNWTPVVLHVTGRAALGQITRTLNQFKYERMLGNKNSTELVLLSTWRQTLWSFID